MKIRITFEVDNNDRDAIAHFFGASKRAPYDDMKGYLQDAAESALEEACHDWGVTCEAMRLRAEEQDDDKA